MGIVLRGCVCMEMQWFYTQWDSVWVRLRAAQRQPLICVAILQTPKYRNVNICTKVDWILNPITALKGLPDKSIYQLFDSFV